MVSIYMYGIYLPTSRLYEYGIYRSIYVYLIYLCIFDLFMCIDLIVHVVCMYIYTHVYLFYQYFMFVRFYIWTIFYDVYIIVYIRTSCIYNTYVHILRERERVNMGIYRAYDGY